MSKINDLSGQTLNNLFIKSRSCSTTDGHAQYICKCLLCGTEKLIRGTNILTGNSKGCGCGRTPDVCCVCNSITQDKLIKGGMVHYACQRLRSSYYSMIDRCYNEAGKNYIRYGARGITVCERWHRDNPKGRKNFYIDAFANGWQPGYEIHRIDNNVGYLPKNVEWLTSTDHWQKHFLLSIEIKKQQAKLNIELHLNHSLAENECVGYFDANINNLNLINLFVLDRNTYYQLEEYLESQRVMNNNAIYSDRSNELRWRRVCPNITKEYLKQNNITHITFKDKNAV